MADRRYGAFDMSYWGCRNTYHDLGSRNVQLQHRSLDSSYLIAPAGSTADVPYEVKATLHAFADGGNVSTEVLRRPHDDRLDVSGLARHAALP